MKNTSFFPLFGSEINTYEARFVDFDGSLLSTQTVGYGQTAQEPKDPLRSKDAQYTYTFSNWDPEVKTTPIVKNTTFTATYSCSLNTYEVRFIVEGETVKTAAVPYGSKAEYNEADPTKTSTAQFAYEFTGWLPDLKTTIITEDTAFTALFKESLRSYPAIFKDANGTSILQQVQVPYGEKATYTGEKPTKESTIGYDYEFSGWSPSLEDTIITEDTTFTPLFKETVRQYNVTFLDEDGTVLERQKVNAYGQATYQGATPEKESTAGEVFTFSHWENKTSTNEQITQDTVYQAVYTTAPRSYAIRFHLDGGAVITENLNYGEMAVYFGTEPTKASDGVSLYSFEGWNPTLGKVIGEADYYAVFSSHPLHSKITFLNQDGTLLSSQVFDYGTMPSYEGATPTLASSVSTDYAFAGWVPELQKVSEDMTYQAFYTETTRSYTITYKNEDGMILKSEQLPYGSLPAYEGTPAQIRTGSLVYTFSHWDKPFASVEGDATYTALYTSTEDLMFGYEVINITKNVNGVATTVTGLSISSIFYSVIDLVIPNEIRYRNQGVLPVFALGSSLSSKAFKFTTISLPKNLRSIPEGYLVHPSLLGITISPENETFHLSSDGYCFQDSEGIITLTNLPDTLNSLTLPSDAKTLRKSALAPLGNRLETLDLGPGIVAMPPSASTVPEGYDALKIKNIKAPALTTIYEGSFSNIGNLRTLSFGGSLASFPSGSLSGCSTLKSIEVAPGGAFASEDHIALRRGAALMGYAPLATKAYTIPSTIRFIDPGAFQKMAYVAGETLNPVLTLNDQITSFPSRAFSYCQCFVAVNIKSIAFSIGDYAFEYSGITSIGYAGTKIQWRSVQKSSNWKTDSTVRTIACKDGAADPLS